MLLQIFPNGKSRLTYKEDEWPTVVLASVNTTKNCTQQSTERTTERTPREVQTLPQHELMTMVKEREPQSQRGQDPSFGGAEHQASNIEATGTLGKALECRYQTPEGQQKRDPDTWSGSLEDQVTGDFEDNVQDVGHGGSHDEVMGGLQRPVGSFQTVEPCLPNVGSIEERAVGENESRSVQAVLFQRNHACRSRTMCACGILTGNT